RIDHVDDAGQAARQLIAVLPEGFACLFLSSRRGPGQLNRAAPAALAGRPAGAAEEGLDAVLLAAVAAARLAVFGAAPGQRVVPPFAGNAVGAAHQLAVEHQPAADAGAENHAENAARTGAGSIAGLGKGEAVGVVGQPYRA